MSRRHRFPLLMYSSSMVTHSTFPASLAILVVLVLLIGLLAAGYFGGREYVSRRVNRRNWK
jgi:hypothetical protein